MWELIFIGVAKLVTWILDRMKASEELKKHWFEFIKSAGNDLSSVKIYDYGNEAMEYFDENPFVES